MFFRFASTRIILGANLAIVAFIYFVAAPSSGFYGFLFAGVLTILQVFGNLAFAVSFHLANRIAQPPLPSVQAAVKAFWLSIGLVLLLSFPACYLAATFSA